MENKNKSKEVLSENYIKTLSDKLSPVFENVTKNQENILKIEEPLKRCC